MTMQCKLIILDEVNCAFVNLQSEHLIYFYEEYGLFAKGYFFNPKYQIGSWDGKIRFFHKTGKTFIVLLSDIIPRIINLGYDIEVVDNRTARTVQPALVDEHFFSHVIDPESGTPWKFRDYQVESINKLITNASGILIVGTGGGKAQPLYSNVVTPSGCVRMGDITTGSVVCTPNNKTATVIATFPFSKKEIFKITFHDNSSTHACGEHLWKVNYPITDKHSEIRILSTTDIHKYLFQQHNNPILLNNITIPLCEPIEYHVTQDLPLNPYQLGRLLGRVGCPTNGGAACDSDLKQLKTINLDGRLSTQLRIPLMYMTHTIDNRIELLRGFLSTGDDSLTIKTISESLSNDIKTIVQSIGGISINTVHDSVYTCSIKHPTPNVIFGTNEHQFTENKHIALARTIQSVEFIGYEDAQCILLDSHEHLYLTDEFIVTHNTSMCAAIASSYEIAGNLRSIIIVPDTTLTDQTKEEYAFFGLDVGEYSGSAKDLDHQHIVATWQTLQNNPVVMQQFDMLICDEVQGARGPVLNKLLVQHGKDIPYRFGCTGTLPDDESDAMSVRTAIGEVQHEVPASFLIDQGHLATINIDIIQMEVNLKQQHSEYLSDVRDVADAPNYTYAEFKAAYYPDFASEKAFLHTEKTRLAWIANYLEGFKLLDKGNCLCLVNGVAFGKKLAKSIPDSVFLHGKDSVEVRKKIYQSFNDNNDLIVIATVNIAGTGLNIKRIFNLVMVDMGKSFIRVIQSLGRGLRKANDKNHIYVADICSDLKYSRKHLSKRKQYYDDAKYPYNTRTITY